jgi:threonine/homoserine/homoserine lactone efflux protein
MSAIDGMSAGRTFGLGVIITVINPKELALLLGVGLTIGSATISPALELLLAVIFVVLATLTLSVPVLAILLAPTRVTPALRSAGTWLTANNAIVMGVILIVIGAIVLGGAISEL